MWSITEAVFRYAPYSTVQSSPQLQVALVCCTPTKRPSAHPLLWCLPFYIIASQKPKIISQNNSNFYQHTQHINLFHIVKFVSVALLPKNQKLYRKTTVNVYQHTQHINLFHIVIFVSVEHVPFLGRSRRFSLSFVVYPGGAVCIKSSRTPHFATPATRVLSRTLAHVLGGLGSDAPQQPTLKTPAAQVRFRGPAGVLFALGG